MGVGLRKSLCLLIYEGGQFGQKVLRGGVPQALTKLRLLVLERLRHTKI